MSIVLEVSSPGPEGRGLKPAGAYDSTKSYVMDSLVRVGNVQWRALKDVPAGNAPAENSYWTLFFDGEAAQDAAQGFAQDAEAALTSLLTQYLGDFADDASAAAFAAGHDPVLTLGPGSMYFNTALGKLRIYNGSVWASYDAAAQAVLLALLAVYVGAHATDPTEDAAGNELITGALYFNTPTGKLRIRDGAHWVAYDAAAQAVLVDLVSRYLGASAADPTVDPAGNPLVLGALYFHSGTGKLRVWNGAAWVPYDLDAQAAVAAATAQANAAAAAAASALGSITTITDLLNSISALALLVAAYASAAQVSAASAAAVSQTSLAGVTKTTALSTTINGLYVYNPRLDSDGGAWRHKIKKTSYYNETLNTATRGASAAFPASAQWFFSTGLLSCNDNSNPATASLWKSWDFTGYSVATVRAKNGYVVIGCTTANGTFEFDLILDKVFNRTSAGFFVADQNVANFKPSTAVWTSLGSTLSDGALAGTTNIVTSIAITIQPLTPLNPNRCNLPNPNIVIATNALSSVRSDNRVVQGNSGANAASLDFIESGSERILMAVGSSHLYVFDNGCQHSNFVATNDYLSTNAWFPPVVNSGCAGGKLLVACNNGAGQAMQGIKVVQRDRWLQSNSMAAIIDHRINAGWVPSTAKFAFAESSADLSNIVGPTTNLAVNPDFGTGDLTGWTTVSGSGPNAPSVSGNVAYLPASAFTGGNFAEIGQAISTVIGATYRVTADAVGGNVNLRVGTASGGNNVLPNTALTAGVARVVHFVATATTSYVDFYPAALQGGTTGVDNIKIELVIADRTNLGNSANIVGTITRFVVATGAELAAYGGFTNLTNYIDVPYSAALDFGTGDMCAMAWVNRTTTASNDSVFCYGTGSNDNTGGYSLRITATTIVFYYGSTSFPVSYVLQPGWNQVAWMIRSGFVEIYVNGKRIGRGSGGAPSLSKTNATLRIGSESNRTAGGGVIGNGFFNGTIALPRVAAAAPTADQIAYMYDTEKAMFQPGAKCLLVGNPANLTTIDIRQPDYDPQTDRFAYPVFGTGVSIFEGPLIRTGFFQASTASANVVTGSGAPGASIWTGVVFNGSSGSLTNQSNSGWGNGQYMPFTENGSNGAHYIRSQANWASPAGASVYALAIKPGSRGEVFVEFNNLLSNIYCNLNDGSTRLPVNCTSLGSFKLPDGVWVFQFSFTSNGVATVLRVQGSNGTTISYFGDNGVSGPAFYMGDAVLMSGSAALSGFIYGLTNNNNVSRVSFSDGILAMGDGAGINTMFPSLALRDRLLTQMPTPAYDPLHAVISISTTNATPTNLVLPVPVLEGQSRMFYATVGAVQYGPTKTEKALYAPMARIDRDVGGNAVAVPASQPATATISETTSTMDVQMAALGSGDIGAMPVLSVTGRAATTLVWTAQIEVGADNFQMAA